MWLMTTMELVYTALYLQILLYLPGGFFMIMTNFIIVYFYFKL